MKRSMIFRRKFFVVLLFSIIGWMGLSLWGWFYLPRIVAQVKNPVAGWFNPVLTKVESPDFEKFGLQGERFYYYTFDSLKISGYRIPHEGTYQGTVIALHGYRSNKNKYLSVARYFTRKGFDFVAIDMRGHNESEGDYTGFSYYEKKDVVRLIAYLKKNFHRMGPFILYGHSVGASTALATSAISKDVKMVISESAFADFKDIVPNYLNYYAGIDWSRIARKGSRYIFEQLHIPEDSLNLIPVVQKLKTPMLIIHGEQDPKIPVTQAYKLYKNTASTHKKLWIIPGAKHTDLAQKYGENYYIKILDFIEKNLH